LFLLVIPEAAPSAGGFRRLGVLDTVVRVFDAVVPRRAVGRAAREVRRRVRAEDFLVLRLAEEVFFER
jgi:hypothetical protein